MALNGFQPDASVFTAFWRNQLKNSQGQVTNEVYVNFGLVKWFRVNRQVPQVQFWFNPKEQNDNPDLTLQGPGASGMIADLDAIWTSTGSTTGFQPDSAIDTGFWRYQYTDNLGNVTNEIYICMGAIKWMKTVRVAANAPGGQTDQVYLWFNNKDQDRNPDVKLDDGPSMKLLSDMDTVWAN